MARKGQRVFEPVSFVLEDDLKVPYTLVGTQQWFDTAFDSDSYDIDQILIVDPENPMPTLRPILDWMWSRRILGVDTETTGPYISDDKGYAMNPINPDTRLVTVQIGTPEHVWVIDPDLAEYFKEILESERILKLLHHALYDFKWLLVKKNITLVRTYCSMLAEQLRRAGLMGFKVGLADCARRYAPYNLISKAVRSRFIFMNNGKMDRDMIRYAARDVPLLFPVFEEQVKELEERNLKVTGQLEFDVIACTAEMETGGVYLNQSKLKLLIKYWAERQVDAERKIIQLYTERRKALGMANFLIPELNDVFDLGSNKEKLEALRKLGIELDDVRRATLLAVNDPFAKLLGEYSNITKMTSTYGENMLAKINPYTGLWYPRFAQMGSGASEGDAQGRDSKETTATGRYVSDAQQFPRKQERYSTESDADVRAKALAQFADEIAAANAKYPMEKAA